MTDLERILALWRELDSAGSDYVLATVVAHEGPSYRKPGALMLLSADGRRAGTVSGGCLEAEVAGRAWWLTAGGPSVHRYSTADEDGERPYGSGCGGTIFLLLERSATASPLLSAIADSFSSRTPLAVSTILEGPSIALRAFATPRLGSPPPTGPEPAALYAIAEQSLALRKSTDSRVAIGETTVRVWTDYRPSRPALAIFGAGDDAKPLASLARELGWFVTVADGRSHLATRDRFSQADHVCVLPIAALPNLPDHPSAKPFQLLQATDAAIVMTHSFEQDSKILACLLSLPEPPAYIGVLGPQRRTRELLVEAAHLLGVPSASCSVRAEQWLTMLHAPTGLDLGAESPETIALSILAEIQKLRTAATALPLRTVRAMPVPISV